MSASDDKGVQLGRPEDTSSGRPILNINANQDDDDSLRNSVNTISTADLERRRLERNEDREDRLERILRWQQYLILAFLVICLFGACVSGLWALHIELWGGNHEQVERAHHIFEILMDAGIAAIVGFFAIKRFEK